MPTQTTLARVESFPFDSRADGYDADGYPVYDRAVGATLLRSTFAKFFSDGVFPSPGTALQISKSSGLTVTIDPGVFIINGAMGGYLTDAHSVTLDTAAPQGNVSYGIMLRYDENEQYRSCYIRVVRGDAAGTPQPPAPDQSTPGVMEYRLGHVTVPSGATDLSGATVTNEKGLAVCPYAAPFEKIDMSIVTADARAAAAEALNQLAAYIETNKGLVESALDETTAGYLQQQINALSSQISEIDLADSVDNETIEYTNDSTSTEDKLRVMKGGISKENLSTQLQIDLGIIDTGSMDFDEIYDLLDGSSSDSQETLIDLLSADTINAWTDQQIIQTMGILEPTPQNTFAGKLTTSKVSGMSTNDLIQLLDAADGSAKETVESKITASEYGSWTASDIVTIYPHTTTGFQKTVNSSINMANYSWSDLSAIAAASDATAAAKFVGKTKATSVSETADTKNDWVNNTSVTMRCVASRVDNLTSGGKAQLTFISDDNVIRSADGSTFFDKISKNTVRNGCPWSLWHQTFEDVMAAIVPSDIAAAAKPVKKYTYYVNVSAEQPDYCESTKYWLPSIYEDTQENPSNGSQPKYPTLINPDVYRDTRHQRAERNDIFKSGYPDGSFKAFSGVTFQGQLCFCV